MTALMLLAPGTPMLFQGQEFAASSPFFYFADHNEELSSRVRRGRAEFLRQFPSIASPEIQSRLPDPGDPQTFERSRLDLSERSRHREAYTLHRDLLRLRRQDPVFRSQRPGGVDGAVLGLQAFVLRFFAEDGHDRLLVVNLGRDLRFDPAPEPLLAPPERMRWEILWCSEDPCYGGSGTPPLETEGNWRIPGEAAVVLTPTPQEEMSHA
jgi:maltooligosyltrehalose trehalohydrolase